MYIEALRKHVIKNVVVDGLWKIFQFQRLLGMSFSMFNKYLSWC